MRLTACLWVAGVTACQPQPLGEPNPGPVWPIRNLVAPEQPAHSASGSAVAPAAAATPDAAASGPPPAATTPADLAAPGAAPPSQPAQPAANTPSALEQLGAIPVTVDVRGGDATQVDVTCAGTVVSSDIPVTDGKASIPAWMENCKLAFWNEDGEEPVTLSVTGTVKDHIACDLAKRTCGP